MMDIDKFYRSLGKTFRRVWNQFFKRPVKNINVDNRAYKVIEKRQAAPWHETTKQVIAELRKDSVFEKYNKRDGELVDRLKSVKVSSRDPAKADDSIDKLEDEQDHRKLPVMREGFDFPYVFFKPESVPSGKIRVLDAFDLLYGVQNGSLTEQQAATHYGIAEKDIQMIRRHVDVFKVIQHEKPKRVPIVEGEYLEMNPDLEEAAKKAKPKLEEAKSNANVNNASEAESVAVDAKATKN